MQEWFAGVVCRCSMQDWCAGEDAGVVCISDVISLQEQRAGAVCRSCMQ
jgi:hypothetical protein